MQSVPVQDWPKTSPANAYCPLWTIDLSIIVDIDNLLVQNPHKKFCIFDNKLAASKKRQGFTYRALLAEVEVRIAPFWIYKDCISVVWGCSAGNFYQSGLT